MTVLVRSYAEPKINKREIARYARAKETSEELDALIEECLAEILPKLQYKVCFAEYAVSHTLDAVCFGNVKSTSKALKGKLDNSRTAIVFTATVGLEIDRCIARESRLSPSRALIFQAIGAERIEALCDAFCSDIAKEKGTRVTSRVSPGYSDIPLEMQKDIFALLDCPRRIGVSLNESLIMTPSKSVSAIFGVGG